jgi:hypothetical protein
MGRVPQVKKLLNLKHWLTVPDAARHLSILLGEDVSEADVLRLALDGNLTLSVYFVNHTKGRCGPVVPRQEAKQKRIQSPLNNEWIDLVEGVEIGDQVIEHDGKIVTLQGVWDLKMQGAERIDVENLYQSFTAGPSVDLHSLAGPIVFHQSGLHCQLQSHFSDNEFANLANLKQPRNHPDNYYPAGSLPADSVLVVRTSALRDLEARLSEPHQRAEKPLKRRERTTLLVMIAALAELADIDVTKPTKAAVAIESQIALKGARVAVRTIENHLKRIPDALEDRNN